MLIITLRTDNPTAELGLFDGAVQLDYLSWEAHRVLAETLHQKLQELLQNNGKKRDDIEGIVVFKGPGSFTGLRIGITVANALGYALEVPVVSNGDSNWLQTGIRRLLDGDSEAVALPEYGALPHITPQKK